MWPGDGDLAQRLQGVDEGALEMSLLASPARKRPRVPEGDADRATLDYMLALLDEVGPPLCKPSATGSQLAGESSVPVMPFLGSKSSDQEQLVAGTPVAGLQPSSGCSEVPPAVRYQALLSELEDATGEAELQVMEQLLQLAEGDELPAPPCPGHGQGQGRTDELSWSSFNRKWNLEQAHCTVTRLLRQTPGLSYVVGITTDPYRRYYHADFSYKKQFGRGAVAMHVLAAGTVEQVQGYEMDLIETCRRLGPSRILNIKSGGEGVSAQNPHACYIYVVMRRADAI